ncbi:DUF222 domain-containing protein [Solwaraspora sp. WMMD1047]|uniref:HNH endonuclease signature motif containing protein n=1 Tax=Solwaraspora sp. WMMD1047 TaxID=3016102 RepID=UPI002416C346|nr:HNH endonuclease signature motif containing protein [Solwaraspora sp. WMMD1047]MDG4830453.1 DUF222 domain-containing protein [Solwaraspora sp. WMMD1047]
MLEALRGIGGLVDEAVLRDAWALPEGELVAALEAVHGLEQRLTALRLALVREVDGRGVATTHGASSTAVWLRERLRMSGSAARRSVELAAALDAAPAVVGHALAAATINAEQARVIVDMVSDLPATVGAEVVEKAAQALVDHSVRFEPSILRGLGRRILHHVAPDVAEQAEADALRREEEQAHPRRHVSLSSPRDGRVRLTGVLDLETAGLLHAALDPLCAPTGDGDDRSPGQRRHDALADVCRLVLRTGQLPASGGDRPQLVVTIGYHALVREMGAGMLDTGAALTPATVRRLACDAVILPAVLGGNGQVLDVGRQRRLFTGPLRRALVLRDGGCAFPGCDRPPRWCDGHHITAWHDGGTTTLDNAVLICGYHHRLIHTGQWQVRLAPDGRPEFIPPAWLDPTQLPRRNHYHRRN